MRQVQVRDPKQKTPRRDPNQKGETQGGKPVNSKTTEGEAPDKERFPKTTADERPTEAAQRSSTGAAPPKGRPPKPHQLRQEAGSAKKPRRGRLARPNLHTVPAEDVLRQPSQL
jgi:hypothetical protein